MAKKTRTKKESMFYTRARCATCAATRECAWISSKGWICRTCAGFPDEEPRGTLTPKARPMKKKVKAKKRSRPGRA